MPHTFESGFTILELSIVLVIIGLIIGSVIVGRDLINAARIRAQITQLENYNQAVHAFQAKYNAVPGDMAASVAAQYGFATRAGALGQGDGNGMLESSWTTGPGGVICGETVLFWNDLSAAQLIAGQYIGTDARPWAGDCTTAADYLHVIQVVPAAVLGSGQNVISVYADSGYNYFMIRAVLKITNLGTTYYNSNYENTLTALTPSDSFALDTKIDDGLALEGAVTARGLNSGYLFTGTTFPSLAVPLPPANKVCVSSASGNPYNTAFNSLACTLRIQFN